jgi:hypothetical protein
MRLRGHNDMDLLKLVQRMRGAGFTVWAAPSRSYQDSNGSVRRYFVVDLREESGG